MKITQNAVVEFSYDLEVDGQIVDRTTNEKPLDYIHGTGSLLPKLEAHIEGMEPGDKFDVTLSPADGYGEVDPSRIIDLPKSAFEVNGEVREDLLVPGNTIAFCHGLAEDIPNTKSKTQCRCDPDPGLQRQSKSRRANCCRHGAEDAQPSLQGGGCEF